MRVVRPDVELRKSPPQLIHQVMHFMDATNLDEVFTLQGKNKRKTLTQWLARSRLHKKVRKKAINHSLPHSNNLSAISWKLNTNRLSLTTYTQH